MSDDPSDTLNLLDLDTLVETLEETDILPNWEEELSDSDEWESESVKFIAIETT